METTVQDLKAQLASVGVAGTLTLAETGQVLSLNFKKGQTSKRATLQLGGATPCQVTLELVPACSASAGQADMELVISYRATAGSPSPVPVKPLAPKDNGQMMGVTEEKAPEAAPGETNKLGADAPPPTPAPSPEPETKTEGSRKGRHRQ